MSLPPLDNDVDIERIIAKAKNTFGYISAQEFGNDDDVGYTFIQFAKHKMLQFGLIAKDPDKPSYYLTEKGWEFESWQKFQELKQLKDQKERDDAQIARNTARDYNLTKRLAVAAFILSLALAVLELKQYLEK